MQNVSQKPGNDLCPISSAQVSVYTVPTASPESDGTLSWNSTTLVLVEMEAGGQRGLGYTYADLATGVLAEKLLKEHVLRKNIFEGTQIWTSLVRAIRNMGRPGISSMAISAIDCALWDLKAKVLGLSLARLLGTVRPSIAAYGSGGFTSYSIATLEAQMADCKNSGLKAVKMKVGSRPHDDVRRVAAVRQVIGPDVSLYVDANGAYGRREALEKAEEFSGYGVSWFEEPVVASDLEGLCWIRDRSPAGVHVVAGEYGYDLNYFFRMLQAKSVDFLQADVSRCCGITGFLQAAALSDAHYIPLSSHCVPSEHIALGCALPAMATIEYFYDHARIEHLFFDGAATPVEGKLSPDLLRLGFGLEFKRQDAAKYLVR